MDIQNLDTTGLYDILRNRFKTITMVDANGDETSDHKIATMFDLKFLGAQIAIETDEKPTLVINYSTKLLDMESAETKAKWFRFLSELRQYATTHGFEIESGDPEKSNLQNREDGVMNESKMFGTPRKSYQDIGDARLVINHSRPINVEMPASRTQHIESIYVENTAGERFRYPLKHLNGARAIANHIGHGGNPYDAVGTYIIGLSEELSELRRFKNYTMRSGLSEAMDDINSKVIDRIESIKEEIGKLQRNDFYTQFSENFTPFDSKDIPEELVNQWVDALTIRTFNEDLKTAFPYIYKLVDHKKSELTYEDLVSESEESHEETCEECSCETPMDEYERSMDEIANIDYHKDVKDDKKMVLSNEVLEYIESFYDKQSGTFPIGEERVKLTVERKFGDKAGKFAAYAVEKLGNIQDEAYYVKPDGKEHVAGYKDELDDFEIGRAKSEKDADELVKGHQKDMDHLFGKKKTEDKNSKENWFPTLNAALEAEDLIDEWPFGKSLSYGETFKFDTEDGRHVSIYRSDSGSYERPIVYRLESTVNEELNRILKLSNLK